MPVTGTALSLLPGRLALCGPASAYFSWLQQLLATLPLAFAADPYEVVHLNEPEAIDAYLTAPPDRPSLLVSHFPVPGLVERLVRDRTPVVACISAPDDCVRMVMRQSHSGLDHGKAFEMSVRDVTRSLALLNLLVTVPDAVPIMAGSRFATVKKVISHLKGELRSFHGLSSPQAVRALEAVNPGYVRNADQADVFSEPEADLIHHCCAGPMALAIGGSEAAVFWPTRCFFDGDTYSSPAPLKINMVGPARCVYYGPYLHLPEGRWQGHLIFGFTNIIDDVRLRVEIFGEELMAEIFTRAQREGIFNMPVNFDVRKPQDPLQIRVFLESGEIEGELWFSGARLGYGGMTDGARHGA